MAATDYPLVSCIMLAGRTSLQDVLSAIECFKAQTYPYKELVIVNNAKTQFEASELNLTAKREIFFIDTPHLLSAGMARNFGISAANGRILAQFDLDYWHAPNRLMAQVATLAENEAQVAMLTKTLMYSFVSGRATYNTNGRQAILGTMVFIRPNNIDYPNTDKHEEVGILEKMQKAEMKLLAMPQPDLCCKLCLTTKEQIAKPINIDVTEEHFALIKRIVKDRCAP